LGLLRGINLGAAAASDLPPGFQDIFKQPISLLPAMLAQPLGFPENPAFSGDATKRSASALGNFFPREKNFLKR